MVRLFDLQSNTAASFVSGRIQAVNGEFMATGVNQ